ncbi:MAG: PepSY-associated TM helix domain-containing protein [Bacteroidota bacterium]
MNTQTKKNRDHNTFFNAHTVTGIVISIGLYVIFLCGAFSLFMRNIDNWEMNANLEKGSTLTDYERVLDTVEGMGYDMHGRDFYIANQKGPTYIFSAPLTDTMMVKSSLGILPDSIASGNISLELDASTFTKLEHEEEHQHAELGDFIYGLHYFRPIPVVGQYLSGLVALFFFFAIMTGLIIHWKKILKNLFTFRLKSSLKNLWADAHTALGVIGLPFQLMYAITGAVFGLTILLFLPYAVVTFEMDRDAMMAKVYPSIALASFEPKGYTGEQGEINALVNKNLSSVKEVHWNDFQVFIKNYKDEEAHLGIVYFGPPSGESLMASFESTYRLKDGALLNQVNYGEFSTFSKSMVEFVHQIHFGNYGSYLVKIAYFLAALLTCFMIISGLMIWIKVREKKAFEKDRKINQRIGRFSIGACMGLFPGLALLFILTKLIPIGLTDRFAIITYLFGLFWLVYTAYAMYVKDYTKITKHAFFLAGVFGLIVPIANGLQSGVWLWRSIDEGLIDSFFIDTAWLGMGLISLYLGVTLKSQNQKSRPIEIRETKKEEYLKKKSKPVFEPKLRAPQPVLNIKSADK